MLGAWMHCCTGPWDLSWKISKLLAKASYREKTEVKRRWNCEMGFFWKKKQENLRNQASDMKRSFDEFHQMVQLDSWLALFLVMKNLLFSNKRNSFCNAAQVAESKRGRPPQSHGPLVENMIEVDRRCCLCCFTCRKSSNKVSFIIM